MLAYLRSLVARRASWRCSVPIGPSHNETFAIPVAIPMWGILQEGQDQLDHIHVGTHLNWVFHTEDGKIIGAAVYAVRDRFQAVEAGDV